MKHTTIKSALLAVQLLVAVQVFGQKAQYNVNVSGDPVPVGNYTMNGGASDTLVYGIYANGVDVSSGIGSGSVINVTNNSSNTNATAYGVYITGTVNVGAVNASSISAVAAVGGTDDAYAMYLDGVNMTGDINVGSMDVDARNAHGIFASGSTFQSINVDSFGGDHTKSGAGTVSGMSLFSSVVNGTISGKYEVTSQNNSDIYGISLTNTTVNDITVDLNVRADAGSSPAYGIYTSHSNINGTISGNIYVNSTTVADTYALCINDSEIGLVELYAVLYQEAQESGMDINELIEAQGMDPAEFMAMITSPEQTVLKVGGDSTFDAQYAVGGTAKNIVITGDGNTQTFIGNIINQYIDPDTYAKDGEIKGGAITFTSGNYVFDASRSGSVWESENGAIHIAGDASAKFLKRTSMTAAEVQFDGEITLVATTNTDYVSLYIDAATYGVGNDATLSLLLGDDFEIYDGLTLYLIDLSETNTIAKSFDKITIYDSIGNIIDESRYTFDGYKVVFVIPEPATVAAVMGALALCFAAYRRRK